MNEELQKRISAALDSVSAGAKGSDRELAALKAQSAEAAAYARDLERLDGMLRDWPLPDPGDDAMEALALRIEQRLDEDLPRIADPTLPPTFDDDDELRDATAGLLGGAGVSSGEYETIDRMSLVPEDAPAPVVIRKPTSVPPPPPPPPKTAPAKPEAPAVRAIPKLATAAEIKKQSHDPDRISFPTITPTQSIASVTPITPKKDRRPMGWLAGLAAAAAVGLGILTTTSMYESGALPSPGSLASSAEPMPADGRAGRAVEEASAPAVAAEVPATPVSPAPPPASIGAGEGAMRDQGVAPARRAEPAYGVLAVREDVPGARSTRGATASAGPAPGGGAGGGAAQVDALLEGSASSGGAALRRARAAPAAAPARVAPTTTAPRTSTAATERASGGAPVTGSASDVSAQPEARAVAPRQPAEPETEAAPEDLPELPERGEVLAALQRIEPAVRACAADTHGTATVRIVVAPSGRVTTATVSGPFAGTPVGSCVARAVRTARLPRFSSERFEITYPFTL